MTSEEAQRVVYTMAYLSVRMEKPVHELLRETIRLGEAVTACLLCCDERYVISWFPRPLPDGRFDAGWEPSAGFIAAALATLRNTQSP